MLCYLSFCSVTNSFRVLTIVCVIFKLLFSRIESSFLNDRRFIITGRSWFLCPDAFYLNKCIVSKMSHNQFSPSSWSVLFLLYTFSKQPNSCTISFCHFKITRSLFRREGRIRSHSVDFYYLMSSNFSIYTVTLIFMVWFERQILLDQFLLAGGLIASVFFLFPWRSPVQIRGGPLTLFGFEKVK